MPIRINGVANARLGRMPLALENFAVDLDGLYTDPTNIDGSLVAGMADFTSSVVGQFALPSSVDGSVSTTLGNFSISLIGNQTQNIDGSIGLTLGGFSSSFINLANTSQIEAVARTTAVRSWGEITGFNDTAGITYVNDGGSPRSIFEFSNRMPVDPIRLQFRMVGGSDPQSPSGHEAHAIYDFATNNWSTASFPPGSFPPVHSYDCNEIVNSRREQWYHPRGGNNAAFAVQSVDNNNGWTNVNNWPVESSDGDAFCWFPARDSLILLNSGENGDIREYDLETRSSSGPIATPLTQNSSECVCQYSPKWLSGQSERGCVFFGSGQFAGQGQLCRMAPDGTFTLAPPYPGGGDLDAVNACVVADPVSGNLLCFVGEKLPSTFPGQVWELDAETLVWTRITEAEGGGPFQSGSISGIFAHAVSSRVDNYGVIVITQVRSGLRTAMYVYKHTESISFAEIDADPDYINWADFETTDHVAPGQEYFLNGQSGNLQLTDTTDPDRSLRDHPNASAFSSGGFLNGSGSDLQNGANMPWLFAMHTLDGNPNSGPAIGPRIVNGISAFEDIVGPVGRSCLRFVEYEGDSDKAGGDFVFPLKRVQPPGSTSMPFLFAIAGVGAEIWVSYDLAHDPLYLTHVPARVGGGTTGPKRSNLHGFASSSQFLEILITDNGVIPRLIDVSSNTGSIGHGPAVREYNVGWRRLHLQLIMPSSQSASDGIVRVFVDEETTPINENLAVNFDPTPQPDLETGLVLDVNTGVRLNTGFGLFDLTGFVTGKDPSQNHEPLISYRDNIVIGTKRVPKIRPPAPQPLVLGSMSFRQPAINFTGRVRFYRNSERQTVNAAFDGEFVTQEMWIKPSANAADNPQGPQASWTNTNIFYDCDVFGTWPGHGMGLGNNLHMGLDTSDGFNSYSAGPNLLDGQWHHVGFMRQRSTGNIWLLVDGVIYPFSGPTGSLMRPDTHVPLEPVYENSDPYRVVAAEKHDLGFDFTGEYTEDRLSTVLRYPTSGTYIVPRQPFVNDEFTAGLWHYNEQSGTRVKDYSGNENHGTVFPTGTSALWSTDSPFN